jgi:hypothetical protein
MSQWGLVGEAARRQLAVCSAVRLAVQAGESALSQTQIWGARAYLCLAFLLGEVAAGIALTQVCEGCVSRCRSLILFGAQNRTFGSYLATIDRILTSVVALGFWV